MKLSRLEKLLKTTAIAVVLSAASTVGAAAQNEIVTHDDLLAQVNDAIPSFAGVFLEGDTAVVLSTDPTLPFLEEDVVAAIDNVLGQIPFAGVDSVDIRPATHTFKKLQSWFEQTNSISGIDGITFRDIDERENKLVFGLTPEANQGTVESFLTSKGIPLSAVSFEESEYEEPDVDLRDRFRPVPAGVQIVRDSGGACTLGFNAKFGEKRFFITNSHCTNTNGGVEGTKFDQPIPSPFPVYPSGIGVEVADPVYTTNQTRCLPGNVCRYSDSAAIEYYSGVPYSLGEIARPRRWGSIEVAINSPIYEIENMMPTALQGMLLAKVGRTTGRTGGSVSRTCADTFSPGGIQHICQNFVSPSQSYGGGVIPLRGGGDSGSPVFRVNDKKNGIRQVTLVGIHRSGLNGDMIHSPVGLIFFELAPAIGAFQVR